MRSSQNAVGASTSVALVLLFAVVAWALIAKQPLTEIDLRLASTIQSHRNPLLDWAMSSATFLCSWQIVVTGAVLVIIYLAVLRRWLRIAVLLVSIILGDILVWVLKTLFLRSRPDQSVALLPAQGPSFPSGHTFVACAFYGLVAAFAIQSLRPRWAKVLIGVVAAAAIITVGLSRVYVGAHWPSDVVASYILGAAWLTALLTGSTAYADHIGQTSPPISMRPSRALAGVLIVVWLGFVGTFNYLHPVVRVTQPAGVSESEFP